MWLFVVGLGPQKRLVDVNSHRAIKSRAHPPIPLFPPSPVRSRRFSRLSRRAAALGGVRRLRLQLPRGLRGPEADALLEPPRGAEGRGGAVPEAREGTRSQALPRLCGARAPSPKSQTAVVGGWCFLLVFFAVACFSPTAESFGVCPDRLRGGPGRSGAALR